MKHIFISFIIFISVYVTSFAKDDWKNNKPVATFHGTFSTYDGEIQNSIYTLEQPKIPKNFNQTLEYSINVFIPFTKEHHIAKSHNQLVFDQYYETAKYGLRNVPESLFSKKPNSHVIVAGDSNTFGIGVDIKNTLPVLLSKNFPDSHPYNFGIRGGGPHNTLGLMEFFPWDKMIKEKKGIFIYSYYDYLIERVIGFKSYIEWSKGYSPYYKLNDEGIATYQGSFNERFLTKIFVFINSIKWLRELLPILPRPNYSHSVLLGKVFLKMYNEYKKKFPEGQFYVAINYNFHPVEPGRLQELETELTKNKVPFVVVPRVTMHDLKYLFQDYHLNPEGHKLEADLILKVLPLNKITRQPNIHSTNQN